ncbi:MAG: hypothetical protein ACJ76I_04855 [Gaiellaceae bacterium]
MADREDLDFTIDGLRSAGFGGFTTFADLLDGQLQNVPCEPGTYVVIRASDASPTFLDTSCGGHFKGRDPAVRREILMGKWNESCALLYIGKADRSTRRRSLRRRLHEYARFGRGEPIGHWGGRYIWQLADSEDLLVAWRAAQHGQTGADAESELVAMFKERYGRLPFANINDPSRRKR